MECEVEITRKNVRSTNIIEADMEYIRVDTTKVESYKHFESRDGGPETLLGEKTGFR